MGHINLEVKDTDLLWHDLNAMIVFLLMKKQLGAVDCSSDAKLWEQWRWDLEGAGLLIFTKALENVPFRERFLAAIDGSIATINQFGDFIPKDYLTGLDDIWNTKFAKDIDAGKVNKCLVDLKSAIVANYLT